MKIDIYDYPEFLNSIKSDTLVYLFGTGISASLTGHAYSWWKWILDGIHHMKDTALAAVYEQSLNDDSSTDNMIGIVGKVLFATKADGTYDAWMKEAFETNSITNKELSRTLQKLLLTQDVFATTNYDLLLEQATGLGTLSYENPDVAFPMLDQHVSTHVLHIHGVYDSVHKLDNIIADKDQYDAVMGNEGAQFIQNILGTRTLVFIGCGKTTEDGNISRFIQFAKDHLKMDKKYYFLHRAGESMAGMPNNIALIPYGDEYADLPLFLEDMAQARLKSHIERSPLIGRTAYQDIEITTDALLKYHYSQQMVPFSGRTSELKRLSDFINNDEDFSWWSVTGQAGAGKSRLALECLRMLPCTWFGFFLNDYASIKDVADFVPFSNTVVIIDYVKGREGAVAEMMRKLSQLFESGVYKLRILLLERENSRKNGSWYAKLIQRFGRFDAQKFRDSEYDQAAFLNLGDLEIEAVEKFIGDVCELHGLPSDSDRDKMLCHAYAQKFEKLQFRPLFVQIFVESWIENDFSLPRYDNFEDLLKQILEREQERWLDSFDGDQACCNAFLGLLIRANISGQIDIANIPETYKEDWEKVNRFIESSSFPGKQRDEHRQSMIHSICQDIDENPVMIAPLFPDIIKEYMFFFYMEKDKIPQVMSEIWRNASKDFSVFITRCLTDFPDNDFFRYVLQVYDANTTDVEVLQGRLNLLQKRVVEDNDDPEVLIDIIDNEYVFWKDIVIPEKGIGSDNIDMLATLKLTGLNYVARQYGGWSWYDMSLMMEVIHEALKVKGGPATSIMKQFYLQEHIRQLSMAGFSDEAQILMGHMNELLSDDKDSDWNSYQRMLNANVEMMNYLLVGDFSKAMKVLKRMEEECKYSYVEAVQVLMHSCFNMSNFSFMAGEAKCLDQALMIAEKTALLYPDDTEIVSRKLGCKIQKLQFQYFVKKSISDGELREKLQEIDETLNNISFGGSKNSDEALSMAWGSARTLKLNIIDKDETALRELIHEADLILEKNPQLTEVAATMLQAIRALHKNILRNKISTEEIKNVFKYVELNYDSESLREVFFEMLDESEEANNRQAYLTKWVTVGAIQDARYNPINSSGISEIDDDEQFMRSFLKALEPQEPYRRKYSKVGANDPCPCGSGKKFKKCCRGNGRFDS